MFDGSSSSDPDGDSLTYLWNVGDGTARASSLAPRTYADEGSYDVTLIVSDRRGASDTATTQVSVENAAPVLGDIVTPAGSVAPGTSTALQMWARDPGVNDVLTIEIDWKDGDTSTHNYERPMQMVSLAHTYATPGNYTVDVTVRDDDGGVTTRAIERPINVVPRQNRPPVAQLSGPASGKEGFWLPFSAAASSDPDGDSLTVTWHSSGGEGWERACLEAPWWKCEWWWLYPDQGTYTVSVIVADDKGARDTATIAVTILNSPPVASWWWVPAHEAVGIPGHIEVRTEDMGAADLHALTVTVDWGDGSPPTVAPTDSSLWDGGTGRYELGAIVLHTYATTGTYSIAVTVRDDDGGVDTIAAPVVVIRANERQTVAGYDAMDLGTLGGNAARAADLNNSGQVVGTSLTGSWGEHAFMWDQSGMHDLGTMEHQGSEAVRINEAGVVAGTVWTRFTGVLDDNVMSSNIGTIWKNGMAAPLDSATAHLIGGIRQPSSYRWLFQQPPRIVRAINSSGDVAWASYGEWGTNGWVWLNGSWLALSYPSYPMAMNDRGQVVGASAIAGGEAFRARLWENGSSRELAGLAPGATTAAMDINESGHIVGISADNAGRYHFVRWKDGRMDDLGSADWTSPQSAPWIVINARGEIAGSVAGHGFFWREDGAMVPLPSSGGSVEIAELNARGEVVGTIFRGSEQRAFVWSQERGLVDLGTGPYDFPAAWVVDINDRGDVLGYTGACMLEGPRCKDPGRNPGNLRWIQVRAILWRAN
jgi:probable HAF family extracellular repeat protein